MHRPQMAGFREAREPEVSKDCAAGTSTAPRRACSAGLRMRAGEPPEAWVFGFAQGPRIASSASWTRHLAAVLANAGRGSVPKSLDKGLVPRPVLPITPPSFSGSCRDQNETPASPPTSVTWPEPARTQQPRRTRHRPRPGLRGEEHRPARWRDDLARPSVLPEPGDVARRRVHSAVAVRHDGQVDAVRVHPAQRSRAPQPGRASERGRPCRSSRARLRRARGRGARAAEARSARRARTT